MATKNTNLQRKTLEFVAIIGRLIQRILLRLQFPTADDDKWLCLLTIMLPAECTAFSG